MQGIFRWAVEIQFWGYGKRRSGGMGCREWERGNAGRWRDRTGGGWISAPASENGFSKYSGIVVLAGRNRPRFAIQAHCGLLVTSVSPNCCLRYGILRKSHFLTQGSCEPMPFLAAFLRFLLLPTGVFNAPPELISMPFLFALLYVVMI